MAYSKNPNTAVGEPEQISKDQVGVPFNTTVTTSNVEDFDKDYRSPYKDGLVESGDSNLCMFQNYEDQKLWHLEWNSPRKEERLKTFGFRAVNKAYDSHLFKAVYFNDGFGGRIVTGGTTQNGEPALVLYMRPISFEEEDNKAITERWAKKMSAQAPMNDSKTRNMIEDLKSVRGFAGTEGDGFVTDNDGSRSWGKLTP